MVFQAEWMAPEVLRNEPADEKYVFFFLFDPSVPF